MTGMNQFDKEYCKKDVSNTISAIENDKVRRMIGERKQEYMESVREKTFTPRIFSQRCECCGQKRKGMPMHQISKRFLNFGMQASYVGCSNCFPAAHDFRKYLEERKCVLTHDDFDWLLEMTLYMKTGGNRITKEDAEKWSEIQFG